MWWIHRRHHCNPKHLVASAAWDDTFLEYAIMEVPPFAMTLLLFPLHLWVHMLHFCWHSWDGACGHSGFWAPGVLGYIFDGKYHYSTTMHIWQSITQKWSWLIKCFAPIILKSTRARLCKQTEMQTYYKLVPTDVLLLSCMFWTECWYLAMFCSDVSRYKTSF